MTNDTMTPLEKIEEIVSDDFCHDLEADAALNPGRLSVREQECARKLTAIYKLAHAHNGRCKNPHDNWKI